MLIISFNGNKQLVGKFQPCDWGSAGKSQNWRHSEDSNIKLQVLPRVDALFNNTHPCKNKLPVQKGKPLAMLPWLTRARWKTNQNELQTVKKLIFKLSAGFFRAIKSLIWSHCSSFFQENRNLTCTTASWTLLFRTPLAVSQRVRIHRGSSVSFAMYFQPPLYTRVNSFLTY